MKSCTRDLQFQCSINRSPGAYLQIGNLDINLGFILWFAHTKEIRGDVLILCRSLDCQTSSKDFMKRAIERNLAAGGR